MRLPTQAPPVKRSVNRFAGAAGADGVRPSFLPLLLSVATSILPRLFR